MAKKIKVKKLKNYVTLILDKSGSMDALKKEVVGGFNQQLTTIREENEKHGMKSLVSLVTFDNIVLKPTVWLEDVDKVAQLTPEDYIPNGMTAMLDAVGTTVQKLLKLSDANDENTSFLVIVISDGQENNSKEYTGEKIAELVSSCEKTSRWTFSYIGANQNLADVSKQLHININNMMVFDANAAGYNKMSSGLASATAGYYRSRAAGATAVNNLFDPDADAKVKLKDSNDKDADAN